MDSTTSCVFTNGIWRAGAAQPGLQGWPQRTPTPARWGHAPRGSAGVDVVARAGKLSSSVGGGGVRPNRLRHVSRSCGLAPGACAAEYGPNARNFHTAGPESPDRARAYGSLEARRRTFVAKRREELGLSQGDIIRVPGYKSRNAVSNMEVGIEGLPAKRAYAWADFLELPRDAFFRFVTGEVDRVEVPKAAVREDDGDNLTGAETELLARYRRLSPRFQRRLREQAEELETLARAFSRKGKP